jgi:hypothetical protein
MVDKSKEFAARKQREEAARAELSKLKQRMRRPNIAEAEFLGAWFALTDTGHDIQWSLDGNTLTLRSDYGGTRTYDLGEGLSAATGFFRQKYHSFMAEAAMELEGTTEKFDPNGELNYWTQEFTKRRAPSFEKISTTWGDMAPIALWLAQNGGHQ